MFVLIFVENYSYQAYMFYLLQKMKGCYPMFFFIALFICDARMIHAQIPEMVLPELQEGEHKIYFDSLLRPVDEAKASFYVYTYFHLGKDVWSLKHPWRSGKYTLEWSGVTPGKPGAPVPLHGVAKWFSSNYSRLVAEEQFAEGRFFGKTILFDKKQRPMTIYDYEKKFENGIWSLYVERYRKNTLTRAGFESYNVKTFRWDAVCTFGCYVSKDFRP